MRIADGVLAEHWDVLQDEATRAELQSGFTMLGEKSREGRRVAWRGGGPRGAHQIGIKERGQRARGDVASQLRVLPNLSSHRLRWQAEYTHECPPHSFAIRKARLPRDGLDGMPAVFQHQPGGLETKFLYGFCLRLARLGRERAGKLAGAQMGRLRQVFHGQPRVEIFPGERESGFNLVGLRPQ